MRPRLRPLAQAGLAILVACAVGGCQTIDTYFPTLRTYGVYMLDINQGNYLSQDMVDKLKVGQTKAQVRQQLGTPLVVSLFRDNRWDYVYEFTRQGVVREHRTFTVYFVDDNFIAHQRAVKELLPHLVEWQKRNRYPLSFACEATLNIARRPEILALLGVQSYSSWAWRGRGRGGLGDCGRGREMVSMLRA